MVFKVIDVGADTAVQEVAVVVIRIGRGTIIGVIIQQARRRNRGNGGIALQAVADGVVLVD